VRDSDGKVNEIWRYVAVATMSFILGGAPAYVSLIVERHNTMTRAEVDAEIDARNAPTAQALKDLKDEVHEMSEKLDRLDERKP